jgi:serine/threonine-protein kinase
MEPDAAAAARWDKAQAVFYEALEQEPRRRHAFVESACAGDPALRDDVLALLDEDAREDSPLDHSPERLAAHLLSSNPAPAIGPYTILSTAGRGGMGIVYLGQREDLGSRAAIKILPNAWLSASRRERFHAEQRTLSRLIHPSIARLYDAGVLPDGTPWFAMEWVDGQPVTSYCHHHQCSLQQRLDLFRQICQAVQFAHQQAILHRDIKPSNIFVTAAGGIRLLDFGIAKQLDSDEALTRTGVAVMTPAYAAPEVVRGEPATVQADVYSLGAVLFELLAGEPFLDLSGKSAAEAFALVETHPPRPPSASPTRIRDVPRRGWADLDVLCLTATHKDRGRRYVSAEALLRDLDRFRSQQPLEARPDSWTYRAGKFAARNRKALFAAAAVILLVASMAAFFTLRLAQARDTALAEAARARRIQQFMIHLFQGGDSAAGPAADLKVSTLVDRSARDARLLDADPSVQADLFQTLGEVYQNTGRFDKARDMFHAAIEKRRASLDRPELLAESVQSMGLLKLDQGDNSGAESAVREALAIAERSLPRNHPGRARALAALGRVLTDQGKYPEAIRALNEALGSYGPDADVQDNTTALMRLSSAHFYSGNYVEAEHLSRRVLDTYSRLYGDRHPMLADPVINLGHIGLQRGDLTGAADWFRKAAGLNESYYGPDHPETAASLSGLGTALVSARRPAEARPVLLRVLAIRERTLGPNHPNLATTLTSLAHAALLEKRFHQAERLFKRTVRIYRNANGDNHHFVGVALANLSVVFAERNDFPRAEQALRDAMRRFAALPPDHLDRAAAQVRLAKVFLAQGRLAEAESECRTAAAALEKSAPGSPWLARAKDHLAEIARRRK